MANTNVTMRIDETLKAQLQELMSSLGLDMTRKENRNCL